MLALTALFYNGYRQELTEANRNTRMAAFELLRELSALQSVTDFAHYAKDENKGHAINGWTHIGVIRDLGFVLSGTELQHIAQLYQTWQNDWNRLGIDDEAETHISEQIRVTRELVRRQLRQLK